MSTADEQLELDARRRALEERKKATEGRATEQSQRERAVAEAQAHLEAIEAAKHAPAPMNITESGPDQTMAFAPDQITAKPKPNKPGAGVMTGYDPLADTSPAQIKPVPGVGERQIQTFARGDNQASPAPPASADSTQQQPIRVLSKEAQARQKGAVIPGGWRPEHETVTHQEGVPVPAGARKAYQAAFAGDEQAAAMRHDIDQQYGRGAYQAELQRQQAISDAQADHAAIQAQRQQVVEQRLRTIDEANKAANAKISSPEDIWESRGAFARVLGAIASGLGGLSARDQGGRNMVDESIQAGIQAEINAQVANKQGAQHNAAAAERLLGLHLDALKDQDLAVDAAKKGLLENTLSLLEQERLRKGIADTDPNYLGVRDDILRSMGDLSNKMQIQEWGKTTREHKDVFAKPQLIGGAPKAGKEQQFHVITIPASDKTGEKEIHVAVPEHVYNQLAPMQGATNGLVSLNNQALEARKKLREVTSPSFVLSHPIDAASQAATLRQELTQLQLKRVHLEQKADDEGVTKDADFRQAMSMGIDYTAGILGRGFANNDELISKNSNHLQGLMDDKLRGATGDVVEETRDENQNRGWRPVGQSYRGRAVMPGGGGVP